MSNNKQSSVEYLIEQLLPKALSAEQFYHIQQAKAMHKEEVTNFTEDWYRFGPLLGKDYLLSPSINQHYNETFRE